MPSDPCLLSSFYYTFFERVYHVKTETTSTKYQVCVNRAVSALFSHVFLCPSANPTCCCFQELAAKQERIRRETIELEAQLRQKTELERVKMETEGRILAERKNHDLRLEQVRVIHTHMPYSTALTLAIARRERTVPEASFTFGAWKKRCVGSCREDLSLERGACVCRFLWYARRTHSPFEAIFTFGMKTLELILAVCKHYSRTWKNHDLRPQQLCMYEYMAYVPYRIAREGEIARPLRRFYTFEIPILRTAAK